VAKSVAVVGCNSGEMLIRGNGVDTDRQRWGEIQVRHRWRWMGIARVYSPRTKSPVEEVIEPRKSKEDEWGKSEREHRL